MLRRVNAEEGREMNDKADEKPGECKYREALLIIFMPYAIKKGPALRPMIC
jgi:hypothetical protein